MFFMERILLVISAHLLLAHSLIAQDKKVLITKRTDTRITVDGNLNESAWHSVDAATDFIQFTPSAGKPATEKTEVKIIYDDDAIYVGAIVHFNDRDSIYDNLAERDNAEETDWLAISFDPYMSGLNAFTFQVSASGVQTDLISIGEEEDYQWNAVWLSKVVINETNWTVELEIPYSALRFPKQDVQRWGINFGRLIYAKREISFWNKTDPNGPALVNYLGILEGIKNIESPLRLAISPYVSAYLEHGQNPISGENTTTTRYAGGADIRYGINDAFTVDMTLIPDFGQVRFDNQVYNLSPFEIQFNENRQFFKEGRDLFDKGEIFYSRRIGAQPSFYRDIDSELNEGEEVISTPTTSQVINATKLSGRTGKGLGIGVFNGVTNGMTAIVEDSLGNRREVLSDPLTNYNVLAFDQNLKNNSSVSLVNTNVLRRGSFYDANTTALVFDIFTPQQKFNFFGNATLSQQLFSANKVFGHRAEFSAYKSSGEVQYGLDYSEMSEDFNINDLGFQTNNNERAFGGELAYRTYEPKGASLSYWGSVQFNYTRLFSPSTFTGLDLSYSLGSTWKNFLTTAIWGGFRPYGFKDYFEPRVRGRYFNRPSSQYLNGIISSNFNKPYAIEIYWELENVDVNDWYSYDFTLTNRFRIGSRWMIIQDARYAFANNDEGIALGNSLSFDGENPIFGKRDIRTVENKLTLRHFFTNTMTLSFIGRHFWTNVEYNEYYGLGQNGKGYEIVYTGENSDGSSRHNTNFNAFTIDMMFNWVFAPGSNISVVWKNSIFDQNDEVDISYFQNTKDLFALTNTNSISIKVLYYIDYVMIKRGFNKSTSVVN